MVELESCTDLKHLINPDQKGQCLYARNLLNSMEYVRPINQCLECSETSIPNESKLHSLSSLLI
jgi:hypothetical protein